jgi:hypothetical protein
LIGLLRGASSGVSNGPLLWQIEAAEPTAPRPERAALAESLGLSLARSIMAERRGSAWKDGSLQEPPAAAEAEMAAATAASALLLQRQRLGLATREQAPSG